MALLDIASPEPQAPPPPEDVFVRHSITQTEYEQRVRAYFGSIKTPLPVDRAKIAAIIAASKVTNPTIDKELHIDFFLTASNSDLVLSWHERNPAHIVDYSIPLFERILEDFSPVEILFSKAIKRISNPGGGGGNLDIPDVVFQFDRGAAGIYYGNLSNIWP